MQATEDPLSQTFSALADPTRRAMLARLEQGRASVSEVAESFLGQMSLPAVTKHLKVLEEAGLIIKTKVAQQRLCELNPHGFKETIAYMEQYRRLTEESLDRLGEYLKTVGANDQPVQRKRKHARKK